jgi:hypothetical protein
VSPRSFARCALLLVLAFATAHASLAADYEVEVIVFRHAGADPGRWALAAALPDFAAALPDFAAARRLVPAEQAMQPVVPFTRLPSETRRLAGAAKRVSGAAAYELVAHESWRQPGAAGVAVYVADAAPRPAAADALAPAGSPRAEGSVLLQETPTRFRVLADFLVLAGDTPVRVQASRNLRAGELHYLDHELLGILLQVTEVVPAGVAPADVLSR